MSYIREISPEWGGAMAAAVEVADYHEVDDPELMDRMARSFLRSHMLDEMRPIMDMKSRHLMGWAAVQPAAYLLRSDGRLEVAPLSLDAESQRLVDQMDAMLEAIRRRYFPGPIASSS